MKTTQTSLDGVYLIEPVVFGDNRGWFAETFRADCLEQLGINTNFVQDNQSYTAKKGTLRGIHYQNFPHAQSKLVRCISGAILDIAVDLRSWSPNYKKWVAYELSAENKRQLYIPRGFGHAFLTLTDDVEVAYKTDGYYNKAADRSIFYADPIIGVNWLSAINDFAEVKARWGKEYPILSEKDSFAPLLSESDCNFGARVLVTGVKGQLGYDVVKSLTARGIECLGVDICDFDLTDTVATSKFLNDYKPTIIVHCAAYTAVDLAEHDKDRCFAVNETGTANLAKAAVTLEAKFIYISTDYVYGDTDGVVPHKEEDIPLPLNVYGMSKLAGETAVVAALDKYFIFRTSWVFGKNGANFVKTMLSLAVKNQDVSVVADQIGSPTYTVDLAELVTCACFSDSYGVYNTSNEGYCSWAEFAEAIFANACKAVKVSHIRSEDYHTAAKRPKNSRLDKSKLEKNGFARLPSWQDALRRYLKEIL